LPLETATPTVACLVPAAGASRRMGHPKPLLPYGGSTFLDRVLDLYRRQGCAPLVVILSEAFTGPLPPDAVPVINPAPERGMLSSLQEGLAALPRSCRGFFIHPVDHPAVASATLEALLTAWADHPESAVKPVYQGRGGHPLLLGTDWIPRLLEAPAEATLRRILEAHPRSLLRLEVEDSGVLVNVNCPDDYRRLTGSGPES